MDQRVIEKFQVIGACVRPQTTTWEDEMKLMDGIPYHIDFKRDFTGMTYNGTPIQSIPIEQLMESLSPPKRVQVEANSVGISKDIFLLADKQMKKERKQEEKWRRKKRKDKRSKKKKMKDAIYFLEHFTD